MEHKLNCVLLIDDDEPTNFFNQLIIESTGCTEQVKAVQSGNEALNYLSNCIEKQGQCAKPDLIFLDINMPAMNGWEFLEKYRRFDRQCKGDVMIIMLTTSSFPEDKLRAEEIPEISAFENKPLTQEKVDAILRKFFNHN